MSMIPYSVLMSVYYKDEAGALQDAIDSILRQTVPTDDFVIVCDGPLTNELDGLLDKSAAAHPEINVYRLSENRGLGLALAEGLPVCKHELVARMDSDDVAVENRCELELAAFAVDPALDVVSGSILEFDKEPLDGSAARTLPESQEEIEKFARRRNPLNHVTVMCRKRSVLDAGNYQDFYRMEDYHLWVRMIQRGCRFRNLPEVLVYVRVGNGMQERRQGGAYIESQLAFQRYLLEARFISFFEYARNCAERIGSALVPASLRAILYRAFLRSTAGINGVSKTECG